MTKHLHFGLKSSLYSVHRAFAPSIWNDAKKGSMRLTEKHIECAHVCARLEISGQNTKKMALECDGTLSRIYKLAQR